MLHRPIVLIVLLLALALTPGPFSAARAQDSPSQEPPGLDEIVDLRFPEPTSVFDLYRALGDTADLAVLFDPHLKDQHLQIELQDVTVRQALNRVAPSVGHFFKLLDQHTLLVAADTPQNRRQYEDLVIRTFYLENANVNEMMTVLRSLVDVKKIATGPALHAITLRDTALKVAIAEELVRRYEKPRAEVEVAVEVLLLDRDALTRSEGGELPLRLAAGELERLKRSAGAQVLAAPRPSTLDGKRARLMLGEAVPFPARASGDSDAGDDEAESPAVQYQEIGLELELKPQVHPGSAEATLELRMGLSGAVAGSTGDAYPVVARRSLDAAIRLGDGETALFSGLLQVEPQPGTRLAALPLLATGPGEGRREVVVALTLHIVRLPEITQEDRRSLPVGSEAHLELASGED